MSRRYAVPVEATSRAGAPVHFVWRGRRYVVAEVLGHWVAGRPWWEMVPQASDDAASDDAASDDGPSDDAEVWRVEAFPSSAPASVRRARAGVYDLSRSGPAWSLSRIAD
ncbi:MAG: DUF6504 family protein [Candidatus Nanopelagicales bacterium]